MYKQILFTHFFSLFLCIPTKGTFENKGFYFILISSPATKGTFENKG
jgi:hypothetical protein